jgi:hypothetical protein
MVWNFEAWLAEIWHAWVIIFRLEDKFSSIERQMEKFFAKLFEGLNSRNLFVFLLLEANIDFFLYRTAIKKLNTRWTFFIHFWDITWITHSLSIPFFSMQLPLLRVTIFTPVQKSPCNVRLHPMSIEPKKAGGQNTARFCVGTKSSHDTEAATAGMPLITLLYAAYIRKLESLLAKTPSLPVISLGNFTTQTTYWLIFSSILVCRLHWTASAPLVADSRERGARNLEKFQCIDHFTHAVVFWNSLLNRYLSARIATFTGSPYGIFCRGFELHQIMMALTAKKSNDAIRFDVMTPGYCQFRNFTSLRRRVICETAINSFRSTH